MSNFGPSKMTHIKCPHCGYQINAPSVSCSECGNILPSDFERSIGATRIAWEKDNGMFRRIFRTLISLCWPASLIRATVIPDRMRNALCWAGISFIATGISAMALKYGKLIAHSKNKSLINFDDTISFGQITQDPFLSLIFEGVVWGCLAVYGLAIALIVLRGMKSLQSEYDSFRKSLVYGVGTIPIIAISAKLLEASTAPLAVSKILGVEAIQTIFAPGLTILVYSVYAAIVVGVGLLIFKLKHVVLKSAAFLLATIAIHSFMFFACDPLVIGVCFDQEIRFAPTKQPEPALVPKENSTEPDDSDDW